MRNIKLTLEYDGTNYCGWQVQNSRQLLTLSHQKKSVQEVIENALKQIFQKKIKIIGSSRTDSGVHAKAQCVNFKIDSKISLDKLQEALNALLPEDVSVKSISEAGKDFNSRFSTSSKIYRYTILNSKHRSALLRNHVFFCRHTLDLELMKNEAKHLVGKHDFSAFCASGGKHKNPVKNIKKIKIVRDGDLIFIDIEADSFLYNMVRNIVGTLIEVARGRFIRGSTRKILLSKNRKIAGPTASAKGLCLEEIKFKTG